MQFLRKGFIYLFLISLMLIFGACANKEVEYNKPAMFWYERIFASIDYLDLDTADSMFAALQSEHLNSPLVPDAMLILAQAHTSEREHQLASFFVDEYAKRFATLENQDYVGFLKILVNYSAIKNHVKDQEFIFQTIDMINEYLEEYPDSRYRPFAEQIYLKFQLGEVELNKSIARVYKHRKKKIASDEYLSRSADIIEDVDIKDSYMPWYVRIFNW